MIEAIEGQKVSRGFKRQRTRDSWVLVDFHAESMMVMVGKKGRSIEFAFHAVLLPV